MPATNPFISDTSSSNEDVASLKSILSEVVGGWPLLTPNWNPSTFDLYRSLAAAKRFGFDSVFRWSVTENPSNRSQNIVKLGAAVLGLPSPNYTLPTKEPQSAKHTVA